MLSIIIKTSTDQKNDNHDQNQGGIVAQMNEVSKTKNSKGI